MTIVTFRLLQGRAIFRMVMVMGKLFTAFVIGNTSSLIALSPSHLGSFYSPQLLTHSIFIEPTLPA